MHISKVLEVDVVGSPLACLEEVPSNKTRVNKYRREGAHISKVLKVGFAGLGTFQRGSRVSYLLPGTKQS